VDIVEFLIKGDKICRKHSCSNCPLVVPIHDDYNFRNYYCLQNLPSGEDIEEKITRIVNQVEDYDLEL